MNPSPVKDMSAVKFAKSRLITIIPAKPSNEPNSLAFVNFSCLNTKQAIRMARNGDTPPITEDFAASALARPILKN